MRPRRARPPRLAMRPTMGPAVPASPPPVTGCPDPGSVLTHFIMSGLMSISGMSGGLYSGVVSPSPDLSPARPAATHSQFCIYK